MKKIFVLLAGCFVSQALLGYGNQGLFLGTVPNATGINPVSVLSLPNGDSIVVSQVFEGQVQAIGLMRIREDGRLDETFGVRGYKRLEFPEVGFFFNITPYPLGQGNFVLGMSGIIGEDVDFILVKFDEHGDLDPQFGKKGKIAVDLDFGTNDSLAGLTVLDGSRIRVFGSLNLDDKFGLCTAQFMPDGKLDLMYGESGRKLLFFPAGSFISITQAIFPTNGGFPLLYGFKQDDGIFKNAVMRFDDRLAPDMSFATEGALIPNASDNPKVSDSIRGIQFTRDGKVLLEGVSQNGKGYLARYASAGAIDLSFGDKGRFFINQYLSGYRGKFVAESADGSFVLLNLEYVNEQPKLVLTKITAEGKLDKKFGKEGVTQFSPAKLGLSNIHWLSQDEKGRLLVLAQSSGNAVALARFFPDGTLDQ